MQCADDAVESKDLFKLTFDCAPIGLAHVAPDGRWLYVNSRLCEMLGYSPRELTSLRFQDVTYPDDLAADEQYVRRLLSGRIRRYQMEKRYIRKNGDLLWASITVALVRGSMSGEPLRFITAVEDISERKRLEHNLRIAEEHVRRKAELMDLSLDAIFAHEPSSNRIIYWSEGAARTYGWTKEEAEGCVAFDLLKSEFPIPYTKIVDILNSEGHWEGDILHTQKDGVRMFVSSRWGLQRDPISGEPVAILEVNRDVTEKRQLEQERAERLAQQRHISESLQRSLLMSPPPDVFAGLTIKAVYQGAEDDILVGGDFFDIFAVSRNVVGLTVGDETGKGLDAALYTAELKFALRAFLRDLSCPGAALTKLNKFVAEEERLVDGRIGTSYAAVAVALIDTQSGAVRIATAGSECPVIIRSDGETVESSVGGPLLGVVDDYVYDVHVDEIEAGDVVLMTTDGLVEARSPRDRLRFYGKDRLVATAGAELKRTSSLAEAGHSVVESVRNFAGGIINDDICLLLARRASTS